MYESLEQQISHSKHLNPIYKVLWEETFIIEDVYINRKLFSNNPNIEYALGISFVL